VLNPRRICRLAVLLAVLVLPFLATAAFGSTAQLAGVQSHVLWGSVSTAQMDEQLNSVQESGASVMRVDVGWGSLQQSSASTYESWYLAKLDLLVEGAQARGIKLLLTLQGTPCWASSAPESLKEGCAGAWWERGVQTYAPTNPATYATALAFLVKRYQQRVYAWEIWNEPNLAEFWKAAEPAAAYVALVKAAYPAAKAADPLTTIVAGAVSQSDYEFTEKLYADGIKGYFDAFSIHPYSENASPTAARSGVRYSFIDGVPKIREVMLANGDSSPLWITETGYSTSTTRNGPAWTDGVSEAEQAQFIGEQARLIKKWPYVAVSIWYELEDEENNPSSLLSSYGLLHYGGAPKLGWGAFINAVASIQGESSGTVGETEINPTPPTSGGSSTGESPAGESSSGGSSTGEIGQSAGGSGGSPTAPTGGAPTGSPTPVGSAPVTVTGHKHRKVAPRSAKTRVKVNTVKARAAGRAKAASASKRAKRRSKTRSHHGG
jgi:Cellulase (glycosyl hydrolase family 5)